MKKNSKIYIWKLYRLKEKEKKEKYREDVKKIAYEFIPLLFSSSGGFREKFD